MSIPVMAGTPRTWRNPIIDRNLADPFILAAPGGGWHLYATGAAEDGRFLPVYRSEDLVEWRFLRGAVAPGAPGAWNRRNFWAPEVMESGGRCWLYYTAMPDGTPGNTGNRVGLAVSASPEGPFEDRGVVVPHASLDGSPFRDAEGSLWLLYTAEFGCLEGQVPGRIYIDRLVSPERVAGEPRELVGEREWQEGPCLLAREGRCYLFYSTGSWGNESYCVRWAVGESPQGPFRESPRALLASTPEVRGPGHHNFFAGPDGSDWVVYHGWDPAFRARYPRIDPLEWTADGPVCRGPSVAVRELPRAPGT